METILTIESRISSNEYFLILAIAAALRGTCKRRKVGCILVDKYNNILATGRNGVASGVDHCIDHPCEGAHYPSGEGLDKCIAIHAEENALIQCRSPNDIHTAYVTASPCIKCTSKLLNTSCEHIVFLDEYPHSESKKLWLKHRSSWSKFGIEQFIHRPDIYDRMITSVR